MKNKSIPRPQYLGFFGIFTESIKTTYRNRKLLLPVLLLTFLSLSQLEFSQDYIQLPFLNGYMLKWAQDPRTHHNLRRKLDIIAYRGALDDILEALFVKQMTLVFSSIIQILFCVATVSSTYEAYTSKVLGIKDMSLKIKASWKNALITSFCVFLTYSSIICVYLASYGITNIVVANSWSYLISRAITVSTPFCYLYVTALWMVSMVVSVLEEGFGGFRAIGRATKLMNGKRLQASVLMIPFVIASSYCHHVIYGMSSFHMRRSRWLAVMIYSRVGSTYLLRLFMFVVYTVFYHERKKSLDQKEVKSLYRPIASGEA
ncbi:hypothetical protein L1887_38490 [Cichorium endivia]|nr:hypothetical protein L1887_38490 [Cichorium endivia]